MSNELVPSHPGASSLRRRLPGPRLALLLLSLALVSVATPAVPANLAPDLGYLRVQSISADHDALAAELAKSRALVLDLRQTLDERNAGETLRQILDRPASARLYVLVSPATPVPVVGVLASNPSRQITLGVKGAKPQPQVVVLQSVEHDRRAYDLLLAGASLPDLISGKTEKPRFDEASLVQEFRSGAPVPAATPNAPDNASTSENGRVVDRVLQRAVHLHHTLQALQR